jgi:hypothetical protein
VKVERRQGHSKYPLTSTITWTLPPPPASAGRMARVPAPSVASETTPLLGSRLAAGEVDGAREGQAAFALPENASTGECGNRRRKL